ncbi:MAG TPA: hypothetical protein PLU50_05690 [Pseudobdellovibrionaceae bacterium]|nr:hypothetical protein [Pseudobdellovibrionaceae bacterium]
MNLSIAVKKVFSGDELNRFLQQQKTWLIERDKCLPINYLDKEQSEGISCSDDFQQIRIEQLRDMLDRKKTNETKVES